MLPGKASAIRCPLFPVLRPLSLPYEVYLKPLVSQKTRSLVKGERFVRFEGKPENFKKIAGSQEAHVMSAPVCATTTVT